MIVNIIDESQALYAKWMKPGTKKQHTSHDSIDNKC